jgi:hypothetical protein
MGRSPLRPKATDRKISGVDLLHPALLERMRQGRNFWLRGQNGFRRFRTEKTCAVCSISSKASSPSSGARRCATFASHRNKPLKERIIAAVDPFNQDPVVHAASHVVLFAAPTRRRRPPSTINFLDQLLASGRPASHSQNERPFIELREMRSEREKLPFGAPPPIFDQIATEVRYEYIKKV